MTKVSALGTMTQLVQFSRQVLCFRPLLFSLRFVLWPEQTYHRSVSVRISLFPVFGEVFLSRTRQKKNKVHIMLSWRSFSTYSSYAQRAKKNSHTQKNLSNKQTNYAHEHWSSISFLFGVSSCWFW